METGKKMNVPQQNCARPKPRTWEDLIEREVDKLNSEKRGPNLQLLKQLVPLQDVVDRTTTLAANLCDAMSAFEENLNRVSWLKTDVPEVYLRIGLLGESEKIFGQLRSIEETLDLIVPVARQLAAELESHS